uniref:EthD domain-containing protein n=1 Tax=Talaromyces stipitatus TaxID=28564 RepID=A0A2U9K745_9EURO|nr:hypothetical protein [Talaromyces stipitatus]
MSSSRVYCLTICACRKEGMDEDEYHRYLSEHHSNLVKGHLAAKGILSYTMIHFKDVLDYIRAKDDPYYKEVILPDHAHFADPANTVFVTGWLETHVINGEAV